MTHSFPTRRSSDLLAVQREAMQPQKASDIEKTGAYVRYFLEHLDELLLHHGNPVLQAKYFGVLFNEAPSYSDIESGTPDISTITGVNSVRSEEHTSELQSLMRI